MKTLNFLIALFISAISFSQTQFDEKNLPVPSEVSKLEIGPLTKSSIYYGATPSNYNGKVLLITHGYVDLNQFYFSLFGNTLYKDVYEEGYQAVFVSTTRGKGSWVNGKILAESIDIITEKYNVPELYIIAHSNGGKASEVAMIKYGKNDKVAKVFALGTPFFGTYIADVAQRPGLSWLMKLLGLDKGAEFSTTYYCNDVFRPYFDNHPQNKPEKFVILGTSSYKSTNVTPGLVKYLNPLLITGKIIESKQATNDGIAPYSSTRRPGGTYVFQENEVMVNHLDVAMGEFCWPYIKQYLNGTASRKSRYNTSSTTRSNSVIESNYYLIDSEEELNKVVLDKNSNDAILEVLHEVADAEVNFISNNQYRSTDRNVVNTSIINKNKHKTILSVDEEGTVQCNSKFVAFVKQHSAIRMSLEKIKLDSGEMLKVAFKNTLFSGDISVKGTITKIAELEGEAVTGTEQEYDFTRTNGYFYLNTTGLEEGVYSLQIEGEREGDFKRTIISGFTVGKLEYENSDSDNEDPSDEKSVVVYPNAFTNTALLKVKGFDTNISKAKVKIYNSFGTVKRSFSVSTRNRSANTYDISNHVRLLYPGIYVLKVEGFKGVQIVKE